MDDTVKIRFEWPLDDKNPDVRILLKAVRERDARIRELEALVSEARDEALEHAAKRCEQFANLYADLALDGLPENARAREAMEATATKLAAAIRAEKSSAFLARMGGEHDRS